MRGRRSRRLVGLNKAARFTFKIRRLLHRPIKNRSAKQSNEDGVQRKRDRKVPRIAELIEHLLEKRRKLFGHSASAYIRETSAVSRDSRPEGEPPAEPIIYYSGGTSPCRRALLPKSLRPLGLPVLNGEGHDLVFEDTGSRVEEFNRSRAMVASRLDDDLRVAIDEFPIFDIR